MALHVVRIVDPIGHQSTHRLFQLGLSFGVCKRKRRWPSLATMNSFLRGGTDDGELGTTIEWQSCELSQQDYEATVAAFMDGESYQMDSGQESWEEWIEKI
jgi:hypothetical protein